MTSALLADVDLDTGSCTVMPSNRPHGGAGPQCVLALVRLHGQPIGELVIMGSPERVLPGLVERARVDLAGAAVEHLLVDAIRTPGGLAAAVACGLAGVPHPAPLGHLPSVTVAVCTRDRPEPLRACLSAISRLDPAPDEVVVIDNASTDHRTRDVVAAFPFARYVAEPRRGLDWARDRAAIEARSDVVAYTDDDVLVDPAWVGALAATFAEEPNAACVTGLVVPAELDTPAQVLFEVMGGFGRGFRRRWWSAGPGDVAAELFGSTGAAGTGANMAFRRQVLLDLGGFDPALDVGTPAGGGGDLEMFFRVVAAGHLLTYEPAAVVRHVHRSDLASLRRQARGNGTGSFTYFWGAGRHYPPAERAVLRRLGFQFAVDGHARSLARAAAAPQLLPPRLRLAETRGAVDAVAGRYYGRAVRQAQHEASLHREPGLTTRWPPSAPPQRHRHTALDVVVDLEADVALPLSRLPLPVADVVRVRVAREARDVHAFDVPVRGSRMSGRRLAEELVVALGPSLLYPGLGRSGSPSAPADVRPPARWAPVVYDLDLAVRLLHDGLSTGRSDAAAPDSPESLSLVLLSGGSADVPVTRTTADADAVAAASQVLVVDRSSGAAAARNLAMTRATGDVVVFLEDGLQPAPGWLAELLQPLQDPAVAVVLGHVLPGPGHAADGVAAPHAVRYARPDVEHALAAAGASGTSLAAVRRSKHREVGPWLELDRGTGRLRGVEDAEHLLRVLGAGSHVVRQSGAVATRLHGSLEQTPWAPAYLCALLAHERGDRGALTDLVRRELRQLVGRLWKVPGAQTGASRQPARDACSGVLRYVIDVVRRRVQ